MCHLYAPSFSYAPHLWSSQGVLHYHPALHDALVKFTRVMSKGNWPTGIHRTRCECHRHPAQDYIPDLCSLVLIEELHPRAMSEISRASWFGVGERQWHRRVKALYSVPLKEYQRWKIEAEDRINRNLGRG